MESKSSEPKKKNYAAALPIVFFTVFIDLIGFSIVLPILAPLFVLPQSEFMPGVDQATRLIIFGFLVASYAIAQFLATPIIGQLADRYGRKPLLAISLIGTFLARIIFIVGILNRNVPLLFLSRIVDGITGGNISVAQSAIADISSPKERAKNFGLIGAAFGLGFILGPYIGSRLGDVNLVSFLNQFIPSTILNTSTSPLWFATILCLLNIISVFLIFPETIKEKINRRLDFGTSISNVVKAFTVGNIRITFITIFLLFLGFSFFAQFLSIYIGDNFNNEITSDVRKKVDNGEIALPDTIKNIPNPQLKAKAKDSYINQALVPAETQKRSGDAFSYIGVWVAIAQIFLARALAKRFKPANLLKWGLLITGLAMLLLLIPQDGQMILLFFIFPVFALANGLTQPNATAIVSNSADSKSQGEILGINASVQSLAQAIPPIINGFITSLALQLPIIVGAALMFAAFVIFIFFYKPYVHEEYHEK